MALSIPFGIKDLWHADLHGLQTRESRNVSYVLPS